METSVNLEALIIELKWVNPIACKLYLSIIV